MGWWPQRMLSPVASSRPEECIHPPKPMDKDSQPKTQSYRTYILILDQFIKPMKVDYKITWPLARVGNLIVGTERNSFVGFWRSSWRWFVQFELLEGGNCNGFSFSRWVVDIKCLDSHWFIISEHDKSESERVFSSWLHAYHASVQYVPQQDDSGKEERWPICT